MKQELKRFPTLQSTIVGAANESLEKFRDEGKKTVVRLVDMESSYLTVDFFRKLPQEVEKLGNAVGGNPRESRGNQREDPRAHSAAANDIDRYADGHFRRIGSNVSSYVHMISETLRNSIPKAVVYCQVKEAKQNLLNYFYTQIGRREVCVLFTFSYTLAIHANKIAHGKWELPIFINVTLGRHCRASSWLSC